MANCTDCASAIVAQEDEDVCSTIVHENVCVQGTVTITPDIVSNGSKSFCIGNPIIGCCPGRLQRYCSFVVSQNICVQIPLTFSASAAAMPNGIVCGAADTGDCTNVIACTHTIGYFRNHPQVTNALITNAGNITLGNGGGLSVVVDTTNANNVLDFDTPSPPAPGSPPYAGQYQVLYAQLLAAKLNVLMLTSLGVEICVYAISAIAAADNFIGTSPSGGMSGAPTVQRPLARFNEGDAPGCPFHCND